MSQAYKLSKLLSVLKKEKQENGEELQAAD